MVRIFLRSVRWMRNGETEMRGYDMRRSTVRWLTICISCGWRWHKCHTGIVIFCSLLFFFLLLLFFSFSFFQSEQPLLNIIQRCILFVWIGYEMLLLRTCRRFYIMFEIMFFLNESDRWVLKWKSFFGKMGRHCVVTLMLVRQCWWNKNQKRRRKYNIYAVYVGVCECKSWRAYFHPSIT